MKPRPVSRVQPAAFAQSETYRLRPNQANPHSRQRRGVLTQRGIEVQFLHTCMQRKLDYISSMFDSPLHKAGTRRANRAGGRRRGRGAALCSIPRMEALLIKRYGSHVFVVGIYRCRETWVRFSSQSEAEAWIVKQLAKHGSKSDPTWH